jgi:hypothetical protein
LNWEGGGLVNLRRQSGRTTFGGGGAGRLLASYRFGTPVSLLTGIEFGGSALLKLDQSSSDITLSYLPAIPFIVRFHDMAWHYDVEVAAVSLFQGNSPDVSHGGRVSVGLGYSALRIGAFLPWAGLVLGAEHYFASGDREALQLFRGGLRIGLAWDPE